MSKELEQTSFQDPVTGLTVFTCAHCGVLRTLLFCDGCYLSKIRSEE